MDTISRENNSMLPVGGVIVGAIALIIGGYGAIKVSSLSKTVAAHQEKVDKVDGLESQLGTVSAAVVGAAAVNGSFALTNLPGPATTLVAESGLRQIVIENGRIAGSEPDGTLPVIEARR